jgi:hypothetical protein
MDVTSTFGGRALDRFLIDYETDLSGDGAGLGGDAAAVEPAGDGGESAWAGVSQEEWQSATETLQQQQEMLEYFAGLMQPQIPQPQGPEPVPLDPLDENFEERLNQWAEQKFAPYQQYVEAQQIREGNARAKDIIADEVAKNGEFIYEGTHDRIQALAQAYSYQTNQQFPGDPRQAAEVAYDLAIKDVREWESAVGKAYHERQLNELATLSGARQDLGVGTNGTPQFTIPPGGSLIDVAKRHGALQGR